jgi:Tol biopolymer transport system component
VLSSPAAEPTVVPAITDPFELYVMKADGSERKLLSSTAGWTRLTWSPDSSRVALVSDVSRDTTELSIVEIRSEAPHVAAVVEGREVRWSPTGTWLAYVDSSPGRWTLNVVRGDGSGQEELGATELNAEYVSIVGWTKPDSLIAIRWDGASWMAMEFNLATGERREVATLGERPAATISNDGRTIAVITSAPGKSCLRGPPNTLWLVDVATGQARQVLGETCYLGSVAWSPDDSLIAYNVAPGPEDAPGDYVLDIVSGNIHRLGGPSEGFDRVLNWLGDGSGFLVRRYGCYGCTPGPPSPLFISADGSGEQLIVDGAEFAVSPDNRKVLFGKNGLQVSAIFGGVPHTLVPPDADWTSYLLSYLSWSPDGEWVSFVRYHGYLANPDPHIRGARQFEVNADGSDLTRLSDLDEPPIATGAGPAGRVPSPGGGEAALVRWQEGQVQVVVTNTNTGQERPVFTAEVGGTSLYDRPVWSPDGRLLAMFVRAMDGAGIYVIKADGTGVYRVVATDPNGLYHAAGIRWENSNRLRFVTWPEFGA